MKVFIIFGAPGSGKSESCRLLGEVTNKKLIIVQKETTRPKRDSDGLEIVSVEDISNSCDIMYSQYNYDYGFSTKRIWEALKDGCSAVVIVNDIRTIKILNRRFGRLAHNLYIHSNIDPKKIRIISKLRYPDHSPALLRKDIERRIEKIKTVHRKYIENTYLFDSAVVNEYESDSKNSLDELRIQLNKVFQAETRCHPSCGSSARVIIIAAGSFTGKDNLVNAMIQMEPTKVVAYQKGTTRPKKEGDKDELLHLQQLGDNYDIIYKKNNHQYGLSLLDIWSALSGGKIVLIVLSDFPSIEKIKKVFLDICTVIYLHANLDPNELKIERCRLSKAEFSKRKRSASELRSIYIKNMNAFDHVLLNTSEPEDLYDQAFNILDYYLD